MNSNPATPGAWWLGAATTRLSTPIAGILLTPTRTSTASMWRRARRRISPLIRARLLSRLIAFARRQDAVAERGCQGRLHQRRPARRCHQENHLGHRLEMGSLRRQLFARRQALLLYRER